MAGMASSGEEDVVSNWELVNQLYAVAAGVRDVAHLDHLTHLIVEVKEELPPVVAAVSSRDSLPFSDAYLDKEFTPGCKRSRSSGQSSPRKETKRAVSRGSGKRSSVKQLLRALALEKQLLLPDAALAQVLAAKQHEAARSEMAELLDEIRDMEYESYNDLPSDICETE